MVRLMPNSSLFVIHTPHGHDGFLIEIEGLNAACSAWIRGDAQALQRAGVLAGETVRQQWEAQQAVKGVAGPVQDASHPKRKIKLG